MAFQSVPETAQIDHIFTLNGEPVQNVHYARHPGGYNQVQLQALADAIDLVFPATYFNNMPPEVIYVRTEVRGLEFENDLTAQQNLSSGPGIHAGNVSPNQVTFAIKKTSGLTGRSARGRTFWIGIARNELDPLNENMLLVTYADGLVTNLASVRNSINATGLWESVLVSRFSAGSQRPVGVTFDWTGQNYVDLRVDTLRGRLPN